MKHNGLFCIYNKSLWSQFIKLGHLAVLLAGENSFNMLKYVVARYIAIANLRKINSFVMHERLEQGCPVHW